jgi:hypothetical protein
LFFTKAKGWEYEKEWRMLNEIGDVLKPLPGDISAVIIGLEMPCDHRATIKNILSKTPEIKYRKTEKVLNQFKLKIVDCESNHGSRKRLPTKRPLSRGKTYPQRGNVLSR